MKNNKITYNIDNNKYEKLPQDALINDYDYNNSLDDKENFSLNAGDSILVSSFKYPSEIVVGLSPNMPPFNFVGGLEDVYLLIFFFCCVLF